MIIALTGKAGSGKSTIADYLVSNHKFHKYSFAKKVKLTAQIIYDLSPEQLYGIKKEVVDDRYGVTPRFILQRLGTEVARVIHPNTWICSLNNDIFPLINNNVDIVIDDLRFENEAKYIKSLQGYILKVDRNIDSQDTHESEIGIDDKYISGVIINTFETLPELYHVVHGVLNVLKLKLHNQSNYWDTKLL